MLNAFNDYMTIMGSLMNFLAHLKFAVFVAPTNLLEPHDYTKGIYKLHDYMIKYILVSVTWR